MLKKRRNEAYVPEKPTHLNDLEEGNEYTLSKFADGAKLSGAVDNPVGFLRDLDKLKKWAIGNLMRLNNTRCQMLLLGQGNS
ncbi:rna-directed dna polymerase from mobile element jockey-like [Pitangus sulphuratus]|nr:rna-directed dna polymerase from mobile element jockey-like [Pitangus sulphuratus]